MRVLVVYGSKGGGTAGIAEMIATALRERGNEVEVAPVGRRVDPTPFDAVVIGGALYAFRWVASARRYVHRHAAALAKRPTWFFSSGPLDDSANTGVIPATRDVSAMMEEVGALGHATAMAKEHSGDWRNPERIRRWGLEIAERLPAARPKEAHAPPGRSITALLTHAFVGWFACAMAMMLSLRAFGLVPAFVLHAVLVPFIFTGLAWRYFSLRGAREPYAVALTFVFVVLGLDLFIVAGLVERSLEMFTSFAGLWLPVVLIFLTTWIAGFIFTLRPWEFPKPKPSE